MISCLVEGVWATIFTLSNSKEPGRPGEIKRQQFLSHPTHTHTLAWVSSSCSTVFPCVISAQRQPLQHQARKEWELKHSSGSWNKLLVVAHTSASRSDWIPYTILPYAATSSEMWHSCKEQGNRTPGEGGESILVLFPTPWFQFLFQRFFTIKESPCQKPIPVEEFQPFMSIQLSKFYTIPFCSSKARGIHFYNFGRIAFTRLWIWIFTPYHIIM